MRYLLNSPVLTDYGVYRFSRCDAQHLREQAFADAVSAIGHDGAARLLERRIGRHVAATRAMVRMRPGDNALVLRLLQRLPEGQVLTHTELEAWPHELAWLECIGAAPRT